MQGFLNFISRTEVLISIAVLVILIILWLIIRNVQANKYKKELSALEIRYNQISSVPLAFKLNKAVAIARVDQEMMKSVAACKDDFDLAMSNLKQISSTLADIEDNILIGKLKLAKESILDVDTSIKLGEEQVSKLNTFLDSILEKETEQRTEVTQLKDKFREIKNEANEKNNLLAYSWVTIEKNIVNIEGMFSTFEEWMYASEFEKASAELVDIKESINKLEQIVKQLPDLLQDARGVVPHMIEEVSKNYSILKEKGVYLKHINVETNISVLMNSLRTDLDNLKKGDASNVREHINDYKVRLKQINDSIKREGISFSELEKISSDSDRLINEAKINADYVRNQFKNVSVRFGLEGMDKDLIENEELIKELNQKYLQIVETSSTQEHPSSTIITELKEVFDKLTICNDELKTMKLKLDSAKSDEERAKKQLLKLQLIMNEMQVKIRKHRLPSISTSYESDLTQAYEYINSIDKLISETPLAVELLNATLKGAIDFIYKLYNNVNNIVGMAIMVENTIVFGNKYRSSYPDIDSELTRAELCFRNGEYTQALTIAIATIDKIHPGSYEKLVRANAAGAN